MNTTSMFYAMVIILCLFFLYSNVKNSIKLRKENMEVLYQLINDDKVMRNASRFVLVFMVVSTFITFQASIKTTGLTTDNLLIVILPLLLIVLYLPLTKKTRITNLGILKRNALVRWEEIKGVDYFKADNKGRQKVKIVHKTSYNKDANMELVFNSDDDQIEMFKNSVKEYRSKKKDKKSGK